MFCSNCGTRIPEGSTSCPQCGGVALPTHQPVMIPQTATQQAAQRAQTALLIELVGGLIGFLGLGRIYIGETSTGIVLLIAWWGFLAVEILLMMALIGFCLLPLNFAVPIFSALRVRDKARAQADLV